MDDFVELRFVDEMRKAVSWTNSTGDADILRANDRCIVYKNIHGGWFVRMLNVLMKALYRSLPLLITLSLITFTAYAAADLSPLGLWKTIDDTTGEPRGLVRIREVNGQYEGRIEKIFPNQGRATIPNVINARVSGTISQ